MQTGSPDRVDRRIAAILATAGLGLALALGVGAAHAGALIEFPSFDERVYPSHLLGYLTRPDGPGPFPAVVVLHGCPGFFGGYAEIADQLKSWGYVALAVDSLGSREIGSRAAMAFRLRRPTPTPRSSIYRTTPRSMPLGSRCSAIRWVANRP